MRLPQGPPGEHNHLRGLLKLSIVMTDLSDLFRGITEGPSGPADVRALLAEISEISASVPLEEWSKLPSDLASQHDLYIYGGLTRE